MIASDNTRDPFYAYGDLDMLEVWREGVRILHLDYPFADWARGRRRGAGAGDGRRAAGASRSARRADLILTAARATSPSSLRAPHSDRIVVRDGVALDAAPPDYAELDALEGLAT